ncbi:MAG: hypothetical protein Q3990_04060, partial [Desulfovibrionaceae bacterium]|nr:hypothetical protein [Desulfovibrionaceae bacterium]
YLHVGKQVVAKNFLKSPVELTKLRGFFRILALCWAWFEFSRNLAYKAQGYIQYIMPLPAFAGRTKPLHSKYVP